jgi:hypothetical protein
MPASSSGPPDSGTGFRNRMCTIHKGISRAVVVDLVSPVEAVCSFRHVRGAHRPRRPTRNTATPRAISLQASSR